MRAKEVIKPGSWPFYDYERYTFSLAVKKGNLLFISGSSASQFDSSTREMVYKGNIVDQARVIYEKLRLILEAAGASFDDVVKTVDYVDPRGLKDYPETARVRRESFGNSFPAATAIIVNQLARGKGLIEVDAIAVLGKQKKEAISTGNPRFRDKTCREAVRKDNLLCLSGISAVNPATGNVPGSDVSSQTRQLYENLGAVLKAAGGTFDDVVKTVDYITPEAYENYRDTGRVRRDYFVTSFPVATGIVVSHLMGDLIGEKGLIELDCMAVLGEAKKEIISTGNPRFERLTYREGIKKGNILFLSGVGALNPAMGTVAVGDIAAQTRVVYDKIKGILAAAGASFDDIVRTVDYVAPGGLADYRKTGAVRREYFTGTFPASTGVIINRLLRPDGLIEIDSMAVVD